MTTSVESGLSEVDARGCRSVFHINADCESHFYPRRVCISIPSRSAAPDAVENNFRWNTRRRGDDEIIAISFIFAASEFILPLTVLLLNGERIVK